MTDDTEPNALRSIPVAYGDVDGEVRFEVRDVQHPPVPDLSFPLACEIIMTSQEMRPQDMPLRYMGFICEVERDIMRRAYMLMISGRSGERRSIEIPHDEFEEYQDYIRRGGSGEGIYRRHREANNSAPDRTALELRRMSRLAEAARQVSQASVSASNAAASVSAASSASAAMVSANLSSTSVLSGWETVSGRVASGETRTVRREQKNENWNPSKKSSRSLSIDR